MNRMADRLRRFNDWGRHNEARHPMRWGAANALAISVTWSLLSLHTFGWLVLPWTTGYAILMAAWYRYLWRPGGLRRNRYERWLVRRHEQALATGWYTDPTGRHRVRYMHQTRWTRWVADGDEAFVDRGAIGSDYAGAAAVRARRAVPLLLGFAAGGLIGAGLIVVALMFPHTHAIGIISEDNTHPVGSRWWAIGVVLVLVTAARALVTVRVHLDVATQGSGTEPGRSFERARAFGYSFVPMLGIATGVAWATWIQNGLLFPFPIFSFVALAACVGVSLIGGIFAVKVARFERSGRATLRSRGLFPALRGAFVVARPI
jgi:hypothetical protein